MYFQGTVLKWTNYIHGWQNRHMVLKDGTMSYFRNQDETAYGCRGSISVQRAVVKVWYDRKSFKFVIKKY